MQLRREVLKMCRQQSVLHACLCMQSFVTRGEKCDPLIYFLFSDSRRDKAGDEKEELSGGVS